MSACHANLHFLNRWAGGCGAIALTFSLIVSLVGLSGCSPIIRPATFSGARDQLTDATLAGPYDGQVVDATTKDPVQSAKVVGVWSYDLGDGFIGPAGSATIEVETDAAGRYRIARHRDHVRGRSVKLVSFRLLVYKRGYAAYRSDGLREGGARNGFTARHNEVELRKWEKGDSHADHLLFLSPPRELIKATRWERSRANLDLYRQLGGTAAAALEPDPDDASTGPGEADGDASERTWLEAGALLTPPEITRRTGQPTNFDVGELVDLPRSRSYHGVHLRAIDLGEGYDISYRVWSHPPEGFEPIVKTFQATLPGVEITDDVTDESWVADLENVRVVAFVDRELEFAALLTCGVSQCSDISTAIILGKLLYANAERVAEVPAKVVPSGPAVPRPVNRRKAETPPPAQTPPAETPPTQTPPTQTPPTQAPPDGRAQNNKERE